MPDNTKAPDDTNGNYSFACSVDFTRDLVDQITTTDENYPAFEIDFLDKNINN